MSGQSLRHRLCVLVNVIMLITALAVRPCLADKTLRNDLASKWEPRSIMHQKKSELDDQAAQGLSDKSRPLVLLATATMMASPEVDLRQTGQHAADAMVITAVATELLKKLTNMPRPESDDPTRVKLGLAPPPNGSGFPSGHASMAFAFATVMADADRDERLLWYGLAGLVSWSRVEVHAHHVGDVLAGAALGIYIARCSLRSDRGLLNIVGLKPKQVNIGTGTLTLGPTLTPKGIALATLEF